MSLFKLNKKQSQSEKQDSFLEASSKLFEARDFRQRMK